MPKSKYPICITLQEFKFLKAFLSVESDTLGNAYQSALKAGYAESYARVILRYFSRWRLMWLKRAVQDKQLRLILEKGEDIIRFDDDLPTIVLSDKERKFLKERERKTKGLNAKDIINELESLLNDNI